MRYVGSLITRIRERTDNLGFSEDSSGNITEGLSDNLILDFLNDAQDYLQSRIISVYPNIFTAEALLSMVANQEAYSIDDNLFIGNKYISVHYSIDGQTRNYVRLPQKTIAERMTTSALHPLFYFRLDGQFYFNPIPSAAGGKARIVYYRELDNLDIRRGTISSASGVSIVLANDTVLNNNALGDAEYVCVVDKNGDVQDYNLEVSSYDSGTRTITLASSHTFVGGANDYVVLGQYASTHSDLPPNCERYLRVYAQKRVLNKDSSIDAVAEEAELQMMEREILESFSEISQDITEIPTLDYWVS